mgnify:CR=1 FL=1
MKKICVLFVLPFLFTAQLRAQDGCEISIKIKDYPSDSVWLGAFYGKRTSPIFGVRKQPDGSFLLKKEGGLSEGLYAILMKKPKETSFENFAIWLVNNQRNFSIETDYNYIKSSAKATNSIENEALFAYLSKYNSLTDSLDDRTIEWKSALDGRSFDAMERAERNFQGFQDGIISKYEGSRTAKMVATTRFLTPPNDPKSGENWREKADARLRWQREHYFDRMDLKGDGLIESPFWVDRLDYFAFKLSEPEPESMIAGIENLIGRFDQNSPSYQYYMRYIMQSLGRITRFRTDEVYVYFTKKYADGGLLNWMKTDDLLRYRDDAAHLEPLFKGKKVPDVTFYDKTGGPVSIYATEAPYLLLVFWQHDCSHCKREIPSIEHIYNKYQSKGLKVMSMCGKNGEDELPRCWQFAEKMAMPAEWILLADPLLKSDYRTLLNVRSYPRLILLDKNKVVLYKQSGELPEEATEREFGRVIN